MGKINRGKNIKGNWVESEVDDPSFLYKSDVIKIIGESNWKLFCKWMTGQTCPVMSDGSTGYYSWDVEKFKRHHIDGIPQMTQKDVEDIFKSMDKEKEYKKVKL